MSPALPDGDTVPGGGPLDGWTANYDRQRGFSVYVHVPFCKVRCGYCDFNTYTATELGGGASQAAYAQTAALEIDLAARQLDQAAVPSRAVQSVFFGGGTPTMLPATDLAAILNRVQQAWGLEAGAEVTTEANPDSVDQRYLETLATAGFTRISFGMQSAVPHVLTTLERTHDPARIPQVVEWAKQAGLAVSLDLIYGTPGESLDDWRRSVDVALSTRVDHISAYALVVEDGTKLATQVRRGMVEMPNADDQADKYELADQAFSEAGLHWYEISNWAREIDGKPAACQHNLAYWRGDDWWGIGPGAHSYLAAGYFEDEAAHAVDIDNEVTSTTTQAHGVRWWNVKHPRSYAAKLESATSPAAGREFLTQEQATLERVMLGIRLSEGMTISDLPDPNPAVIADFVARGLIDGRAALTGTLKLTLRGRLLADALITELMGL